MKLSAMIFAVLATATSANASELIDITVDISEQEMFVQTPDGQVLWTVSTGKEGHDTPVGEFRVQRMYKEHYSRKYDNAPMPHSIFFKDGYAIHGTWDVENLGMPASRGCVRLDPVSAGLLFRTVEYYGMENTVIRVVP